MSRPRQRPGRDELGARAVGRGRWLLLRRGRARVYMAPSSYYSVTAAGAADSSGPPSRSWRARALPWADKLAARARCLSTHTLSRPTGSTGLGSDQAPDWARTRPGRA